MRLRRLTVHDVRGISERTVDVTTDAGPTGVAIIEGPNESGKTSLAVAFDLLLRERASAQKRLVKSLRTEGSDAPPRVEAELEIGDYRFVYAKQYLRRQTTRLAFLDSDGNATGDVFAGDQAHDRVTELLDSNLDRDLWESLLLRQGLGLEAPELHGRSGLTSVLGDASDAGAIGARETDLLERVEREYQRYYTLRAGQPTGELQTARDAADVAAAAFQDLDRRYGELTDDIAEATRLQQALPELRRSEEKARADAEALQGELERVNELRALVDEQRNRDELAQTRLKAAQEANSERARLSEELDRFAGRQGRLEGRLTEATEREAEIADRVEAAERSLDEAKTRAREARTRRQLRQDDLDYLSLSRQVRERRERLDQAEAADNRARESAAVRDANRVDPDTMDRIRGANQRVAVARAALDAAVPRMQLTARTDLDLEIADEASILATGQYRSWTVTEPLSVRLQGVADFEVRPGDSIEDARRNEQTARAELEEELERATQPDAASAEAAAADRAVAEQTFRQAVAERDAILGDLSLEELRGRVKNETSQLDTYLAARVEEPSLPEDEAAARELLEEAKQVEAEADDQLEAANRALTGAKEEHEGCRQTMEGLAEELRSAREDRDHQQRQLETARETESDDDLAERLQRLIEEQRSTAAALQSALEDLEAADAEGLEARAENAALVARDVRGELAEKDRSLGELEASIRGRGADGIGEQRAEAEAELARAQSVLAGVERRAAAATRLRTLLVQQRAVAQERYAAPLRDRIVAFGRILYGSDFDVQLDDRLAISHRRADDLWLDVSALSAGAQEQLYLLSRLACTALLADKGGVLLIDDALGNTDPQRLERLGAVIRSAGQQGQILIFTCYPQRYAHIGGAKRITVRRTVPRTVPATEPSEPPPEEPDDVESPRTGATPNSAANNMETLTCQACGREWQRQVARGPKPSRCPSCAGTGA